MYIKCPLNYTGGKYRILSSVFQVFPEKIGTFVDLFAGGFNVGINVDSEKIICNDHITYIIDLYRYFQSNSVERIIQDINERIQEFQLSQTNEEGYYALRRRYNETKNDIDLFVLTCYSFNHQIRFNNQHEFNTPFGKKRSSFNARIENNLISFCNALHEKNIEFYHKDFLEVDLSGLGERDFVYCDPPYLISTGAYNDGKRGFKDWTEKEERELLALLDRLNEQGVRFALSNVLYHKERSNDILLDWSRNYQALYIDNSYSNCSYHFKNRDAKTVEVLITNVP